jgi:hypothetical protein
VLYYPSVALGGDFYPHIELKAYYPNGRIDRIRERWAGMPFQFLLEYSVQLCPWFFG